MKYSARLVTALAVIAFVAVALVTAIVNVTTRGILAIGDTIAARLGGHGGGMQGFVHRTQAILLVPYKVVEPFFYTMATNAFFGLRPGHGAPAGTMTLMTSTDQGRLVQHRYQVNSATHGHRHAANGTKGTTQRCLSRKIPTGAVLRAQAA